MPAILKSLFVSLLSTEHRDLVRGMEFLRAENRILRDRLSRQVRLTPAERFRLIRIGRPIQSLAQRLISVVSSGTFARWLRQRTRSPGGNRIGRPAKPRSVRTIVRRMATETGWGCTRIHGELKKLGVRSVSRSTVRNILRSAGLDPGPKRGMGTWAEFLRRHAATLWACDFFSMRVWTLTGRADVFVLFFIHLGSRRVVVSGLTRKPNPAWMAEQARKVGPVMAATKPSGRHLLRDRDAKFTDEFDDALRQHGIQVIRLSPRSPNLNAVAERWVQSVRRECLDHFVVCGERHLRYLLDTYVEFYNRRRPHQGMNNEVLNGQRRANWTEPIRASDVRCESALGGLLRHYYRKSG